MAWELVAEGTSFSTLQALVGDRQLPKGTRARVVMELQPSWWATAFNVAGAEALFRPQVPAGMDLVDVYGTDGYGVVEMEADPAFLMPFLAAVIPWAGIIITTLVVTAALAIIVWRVQVFVEVAAPIVAPTPGAKMAWATVALVGAVAVGGIVLLKYLGVEPKGALRRKA